MTPHESTGMTLIEVLAALALSGFVLLGALLLVDQLDVSGRQLLAARWTMAANANGPRLVRALLRDAWSSADSSDWLRGDEHVVSFRSTCQTPHGWRAPCHTTLVIDQLPDTSVLMLERDDARPIAAVRAPGTARFRFYNARSTDSAWSTHWPASTRLPTALVLVHGTDTAVFSIGAARD